MTKFGRNFYKMRRKFLVLIAITVGLFACDVKTTTCIIDKTFIDGNPNLYMHFSDGRLSTFERYNYSTGMLYHSYVVYRQADNKVDYINMFLPNGNLYGRTEFAYDAEGNLGALYTVVDNNNDGFPESSSGHFINAFDANNHLVSTDIYNSAGIYQSTVTFTWVGDNITRQTYSDGSYTEYVYDDKKSVNAGITFEMYGINPSALVFSANNVTQENSFDAVSNPTGTYNYAITYTAEGLPEVISGPFIVESYQFTCTQE